LKNHKKFIFENIKLSPRGTLFKNKIKNKIKYLEFMEVVAIKRMIL